MLLPNSPIRKIHECPKCGDVSLKFYDPKYSKYFNIEKYKVKYPDN